MNWQPWPPPDDLGRPAVTPLWSGVLLALSISWTSVVGLGWLMLFASFGASFAILSYAPLATVGQGLLVWLLGRPSWFTRRWSFLSSSLLTLAYAVSIVVVPAIVGPHPPGFEFEFQCRDPATGQWSSCW